MQMCFLVWVLFVSRLVSLLCRPVYWWMDIKKNSYEILNSEIAYSSHTIRRRPAEVICCCVMQYWETA